MGQTDAVINYANLKLKQICADIIGKPIPNWFNVEDMLGFGLQIHEGDLNLKLAIVIYPIDEEGPGNFLVKLQGSFMSKPVQRDGYEFSAVPIGTGIQQDFAMAAEGEQELMDGIIQLISDEAENILCQILQ